MNELKTRFKPQNLNNISLASTNQQVNKPPQKPPLTEHLVLKNKKPFLLN